LVEALKEYESTYGIKITLSLEDKPLGTAGPIRLAKERLTSEGENEIFFVFNSDIICNYPLEDLI